MSSPRQQGGHFREAGHCPYFTGEESELPGVSRQERVIEEYTQAEAILESSMNGLFLLCFSVHINPKRGWKEKLESW